MKNTVSIRKDMKINSAFFLILGISGLLFSCAEKETPGGVKYTIIREGDGVEPEYGKFLALYLELKDAKDSTWFTTADSGFPVVLAVPDASMVEDDGEYGVFKALTKGDSVSFQLPARIVFLKTRKRPVPNNVDPLSLFTFRVGVKDVMGEEEVQAFQQRIMMESEKKRAKSDSLTITSYLAENNLTAEHTPTGIYYIVKQEGTGENATSGKSAYVNYAGYLLNGNLFDTNIESVAKANNYDNGGRYNPYPVVVNTGSVIRGWDEMLQLMNKGMKVTAYIPSVLAYGSQGNGGIPPNSVLVFDMEVVDIK
jgi:FKBP-type peptidyl-prolyl cis-trans isomerase